jgi:hypothetical protein
VKQHLFQLHLLKSLFKKRPRDPTEEEMINHSVGAEEVPDQTLIMMVVVTDPGLIRELIANLFIRDVKMRPRLGTKREVMKRNLSRGKSRTKIHGFTSSTIRKDPSMRDSQLLLRLKCPL